MKLRRALAVVLLLFVVGAAKAQDLATIVGTLTDDSGGAIPDAQVTVSNADRGFTRVVSSDTSGFYSVNRVPIGSYSIAVEKPGFQRIIRTDINLNVGQTLRVDFQLKIGTVAEKIEVSGNPTAVETETSAISHVVTSSQVSQLNLEARNFANLATLVPGAAALASGFDPSSVGDLANSTISFNGIPGNYNNWEVDGTNDVDQGSGSNSLMVFPSVDSIAEFRISTSNYSAEYAKSGGAQIEVVTKSGTRDFHGDLFEYVRNDAFDANDWFLNQAGQPRDPLKRNNYGFTLGGPIFIPNHYNKERNKTFFFVSEEWRSYRQGTIIRQPVPSALQRQGNFGECDPSSPLYNSAVAAGCAVPINPATGTQFPNDIVPVNPTASTLLNGLIPLPNTGANLYVASPSLPTEFREDMFKIDQNFGDKIRLFVRYTQDAYSQDFIPTLWSSANYGTVVTKWSSPAKSLVFHLTQTLKPNLLNEFIFSMSADVNLVDNVTGFDSPANSIFKPSDFSIQTIFPENQNQPFLPGISFGGGVPFQGNAESTGFQFYFWDPQTAFKDNLIWSRGRHTLKTGFFLLDNHINTSTNIGQSTQGFFNFSSSSSLTTGNALADMFLGRIASYSEYGRVVNGQLVGGRGVGHWRQWDFEPYVQDDFRVNRRLTLNMGVRYYWLTPFFDASNPTNDSIFIPSDYVASAQAQLDSGGNVLPGTGATYLNYGNGLYECGVSPIPKGCQKSYRKTISPRFGFSWDPLGDGKTAIRGGYALNYDSSNPLFAGAGFNGNAPTTATLNIYNILGYGSIGPGGLGTVSFSDVPTQGKWPQIQQYSLGIQRELPAQHLLGLSYVGTQGRYLQQTLNINQVPIGSTTQVVPALIGSDTPGCNNVTGLCNVQQVLISEAQPPLFFAPYRGYSNIEMRSPSGNSNYNSLQVSLRHPTGFGLMYEVAYTWSHTLDNIVTNGIEDSDVARWYGNSSLNQAQMLIINWVYQLPFYKNTTNQWAKQLLAGWQIGGINTFVTGPPLNFTCGINGLSTGIGGNVGCNALGPMVTKKGMLNDPNLGPTPGWFDPASVGQPTLAQLAANNQPGMFGDMGKNTLVGPGRNNWDLALMKNFVLPWFSGEHSTLQFRLETFNTFNHPQWQGVNTGCSGQTAPGAPCTGDVMGEVNSAFSPRILQLGLKFIF
jgi:Carboxypeptidase regulatory-like domain